MGVLEILISECDAYSCDRIRDRTFDILMSSDYNDYRVFSNTAWGRNRGYDSIESVHDQLHGLVGNGGNMVRPANTLPNNN